MILSYKCENDHKVAKDLLNFITFNEQKYIIIKLCSYY
jgi:hypothetical protein